QAKAGLLLIGPAGDEPSDGYRIVGTEHRSFTVDRSFVSDGAPSSFLYDFQLDRMVTRLPEARFQFASAFDLFDVDEAQREGLTSGLAATVQTGTQHGW